MATLTGTKITDTYEQLIKLDTETLGADASAKWLETGKAENLPISVSTTRVGIGTASPATTLDVHHASSAPNIRIGTALTAADSAVMGTLSFGNGTDSSLCVIEASQDGANDSGRMKFNVEATGGGPCTAMTIDSNCKVGIGTAKPITPLTVAGATGGVLTLGREEGDALTGEGLGYINFDASENSGTDWGTGAQIKGIVHDTWVDGANQGAQIIFSTTDATTGVLDQRMCIHHDGLVGIGTATPDLPNATDMGAHIKGHAISSSENVVLTLEAIRNSGQKWGLVSSGGSQITSGNFGILENDTDFRMVIDTAGSVGFGTDAPSYRFHATAVTGSFVGLFSNTNTDTTGDCLRLIISVPEGSGAAGNRWLSCEDANTTPEWMLIGDGSGEIVIDDASDRRLKENIIEIPDALAIVNSLKPSRYNRKTTDASWYKYGFIADEYATVFPKSVRGTVDGMRVNDDGETVPDYQSISKKDLYGVITKAIQELSVT